MVTKPIWRWLALGVGLSLADPAGAALEVDDYASAAAAYRLGDYAEAWRIWQPLAEAGDVDAQFSLGMLCERVPTLAGCEAMPSAEWYTRAAQAGHRLAQFSLGTAFREGRGVARDEATARYWLGMAAAQGLPAARDALQVPDPAVAEAASALDQPPSGPTAPQADAAWLAVQDPERFTVQLAASPDEAGLRGLRQRHGLEDRARVVCARTLCYLLLGAFISREEGWSAIEQLPPALHAGKPWPRRLSYYQSRSL